ncbi:CopG family antitoxin [Aphanothece sacrum]|uniref:3-dehydroquinate synthase n=1 Tax=Aphanothece sacrum FPU1 TaxID=1920663 RepID=A0A401IMX0_APHSA|nr:CopG family antitoxin [Aphanothece sacrum]GBF82586.1 3-dehydroquinate synthase [Aphanothece sacrum FPU1]GBF84720.1 3-dehydroquinate synthase [Aphanothece sacrum FPU3]
MKTDQDVENLLEQDLSDYLNKENFSSVNFELVPKNESVTIEMSSQLLEKVKEVAKQKGINYHIFIKEAVEQALQ